MGFSSWTSCVTGRSIMNSYGKGYDGIVAILPNNTALIGDYDGYGTLITVTGKEYDLYTLYFLFGDIAMYDKIRDTNPELLERMRHAGISLFSTEGKHHQYAAAPINFKVMTRTDFEKENRKINWNEYPYISKWAEGQGHWSDETHKKGFKWNPIEDPTLKTEES